MTVLNKKDNNIEMTHIIIIICFNFDNIIKMVVQAMVMVINLLVLCDNYALHTITSTLNLLRGHSRTWYLYCRSSSGCFPRVVWFNFMS